MKKQPTNWRPSSQDARAEFFNPSTVPVRLLGPDHKQVTIPPQGRMILPEYFLRFTPNKLRFVKYTTGRPLAKLAPKDTPKPKPVPTPRMKNDSPQPNKPVPVNGVRSGRTQPKPIKQPRTRLIRRAGSAWKNPAVGRAMQRGVSAAYVKVASDSHVPISNNIGVGILSYNRFDSLKRLVESILENTDLKRTTLFISDESDNLTQEQIDWLESLDACVMIGQPRLGIAGNTNRLLRCLQRFRWGIILNDDVEVLRSGWEHFYVNAMVQSGIQHFCYREPGIYGASENDGRIHTINTVPISTITEKPHGAILAFTNTALQAVGYFDESFGIYGMEHVDWSDRIAKQFGVSGFHDVEGSSEYFQIHKEDSAVADRIAHLHKAKEHYGKIKGSRIKVDPTPRSEVPSVSIIIPFREAGRNDDLETVIANLRAQRYPNIEITVVEQDEQQRAILNPAKPVKYTHVPSDSNAQPFNKAAAFNRGVANALYEKLILHDADIIVTGDYVRSVADALNKYESCHFGAEVYYLTETSTNKLNGTCILQANYDCNRIVTYFEGGSLGITKSAYITIGGFDEAFEGYGVEDCAFYANMAKLTRFHNHRTYKFFHLWHGRTHGWEACHQRNREYYASVLQRFSTLKGYADHLSNRLRSKYKL